MSRRPTGFTLIELVFVIILIALITGIVIPKVSSTLGLSIRSNVLHVSGFLQAGYNHAIITHKKIRMNIDLDKGEYWAEDSVEPEMIPLIDENTKLDEVLNTFRKRSEEEQDENEKKKKELAEFQKIETEMLSPSKLDSSLKFKSIVIPGTDKTITGGKYSFFIPSTGVNDEMIIYITHTSDAIYSIIFPAITGKPRIEKGEVDPKNL